MKKIGEILRSEIPFGNNCTSRCPYFKGNCYCDLLEEYSRGKKICAINESKPNKQINSDPHPQADSGRLFNR